MADAANNPVRVRFAPSPTGLLHIGNVRSALFDWLYSRRHDGVFILRIEDTDQARYVPEAEQYLKNALRWLGLQWDEGPDVGGPYGPYRQSERLPLYETAADTLIEKGWAYRCYCSRERVEAIRTARQQANIHPYGYDRHCRALSEAHRKARADAGDPCVVRFSMPFEGETTWDDAVRGRITWKHRELDDHVLLKSDGFPTYHLAHLVDDREMRISHVLRGDEWIASTPRHLLQYQAFGWEPPVIAHLPQILGPDGKKLSKRHGADATLTYREQGYLPEALVNFLALLGWAPGDNREVVPREELAAAFDLSGVSAHPAIFDLAKLEWMNGVYIRDLSAAELAERALPFLQGKGLVPPSPSPAEREYACRVMALEQERLKRLDEAPAVTEFFFRDPPDYEPPAVQKWLATPTAPPILAAVTEHLQAADSWDAGSVEAAVRGAADGLGVAPAEVIHPTRVAATGRTVGPGLFETLAALGKERALRRIADARTRFCPG